MSLEQDIAIIKDLVEDKPVFKPATPDQLAKREETYPVHLVATIYNEIGSDTEDESVELYDFYKNSSENDKKVIDEVLLHLCGWTLPTLVNKSREAQYRE